MVFSFLIYFSLLTFLNGENVIKQHFQRDGHGNYFMYGHISVGTPPQKFFVEFTMFSPDIWVLNKDANVENTSEFVVLNQKTFFSSKSSTFGPGEEIFVNQFTLAYSLAVKGNVCQDVFHFDHSFTTDVPVPFGLVDHAKFNELTFNSIVFDGFFGLAIEQPWNLFRTKQPNKDKPVALELIRPMLKRPIYTIWAEDQFSKTGLLTIGDEDKDHCLENYQFLPLDDKTNMEATLFRVEIKELDGKIIKQWDLSHRIKLFGRLGTPQGKFPIPRDVDKVVFGPGELVREMYEIFGVKGAEFWVLNTIPCKPEKGKVRPNIVMYVGRKEDGLEGAKTFKLTEKDYIFKKAGVLLNNLLDRDCAFVFHDWFKDDITTVWSLKAGFNHNFCMALNFEEGTIGFGERK